MIARYESGCVTICVLAAGAQIHAGAGARYTVLSNQSPWILGKTREITLKLARNERHADVFL
jgi:hypothetical protein